MKSRLCVLLCVLLTVGAFRGADALGDCGARVLRTALGTKRSVAAVVRSGERAAPAAATPGTVGFADGTADRSALQTPADVLALMAAAEPQYEKYKKTGEVYEEDLSERSVSLQSGGVTVCNRTEEKPDLAKLLAATPAYGNVTKDKPYILIYHTHTTEGYELLDKGWYSADYNSRTEDGARTVVRVGDAIAERLEEAGFTVLHDRTVHDRSYNGAYDRSEATVRKYLKQYPSIVLTLDVHRDAIHYDDGTKSKPTAVVNGKKAAQVMIISGCEGGGVEGFPNWRQNLVFALALQKQIAAESPSLMRPVYFCYRRYNMDLTPCSLLLEFGTDANTLEEAVYSGDLVGGALGRMLNTAMGEG